MQADFTFTRRDILIGLVIVLIAFGFRLIIIMDRAHAPADISAFDPLPKGSDQLTYYSHIAAYRAGNFPPPTYFYQPGMSYFLIGASKIMRTDNLGALRILIAALASLNCGLFIAVIRLAVGRRSMAVLSGLLLALYPVGAFYDTDFVITSQTTELLTIALFGILWLWRFPRNWSGMALLGGSFGVLAFTRFEPLLLAPVFGLWLIAVRRSWVSIIQVAAAALICVLVTLPVVIHNLSNGADYLFTPVGAAEIYRGNNRDADGTYGGGRASQVTTGDYGTYLRKDIALSPRRFGELLLHKVGLFFSKDEPGNNLNYIISGKNVSPLLSAIPLNFQLMVGLFLFGLAAMFRNREPVAPLLLISFLGLMAAIMLIWVEARLRTPVIVIMFPAVAYGLVTTVDLLRQGWQANLLRLLVPIPVVVLILLATQWAYVHLPHPVTVNKLPESAHVSGVVFDDTLKLVGWEVQEQYSPAGILQPFRPYVITFYWQTLKPTPTDYSFALGYFVDGERLIGFDYPIGAVSYPGLRTSQWSTGKIYVEHVGITYKRFDGGINITAPLLLSVYPERDAGHLLPVANGPDAPLYLEIAQLAIIWGTGKLPDNLPQPHANVEIGDVLVLKGWTYPATAMVNETIEVVLGWETTQKQIDRNLIFSVCLLDSAGTPETNYDSPPQNGRLLATSLPTHYQFGDVKTLTVPSEPGVYTLYALVYDFDTGDRLKVAGSAENWVKLGEIEVREQ